MGKITYYIKKKIGREVHSFSVEGDNLFDAVLTSRNLSFNNVEKCGKCGHDDLDLGAHAAKGRFKYVTIKCKKCKYNPCAGGCHHYRWNHRTEIRQLLMLSQC